MIILRKTQEQREYSTKGTQLLKKGVQLKNVFMPKAKKLTNMQVNRKTIDLKNKIANVNTSIQAATINPGDTTKKILSAGIEKPVTGAIVGLTPGGSVIAPVVNSTVGKAEGKLYGKWTKQAADKFRNSKLSKGVEHGTNVVIGSLQRMPLTF